MSASPMPDIQPLLFKDRVLIKFEPTKVKIHHADQGCAITTSPDNQQALCQFLQLLQVGGLSLMQLTQTCHEIQDQIPELLAEFNRRGFLADPNESVQENPGLSGQQFYRELYQFIQRLKQQFPPSPLSQRLVDGSLSRNQLIGYALESYHVTHLCPRLLAPSLARHENPTTQKLLQEFFVAELNHDKLIKKSLRSVGIGAEQWQTMQTLPMTFAVCSTLGVFARQHPLSFKAALGLFEEDDKVFNTLFEQRCQALDMPADFYRPILLHAHINEDGGHDQITADLMAVVPYVSPEEQLLVKNNMTLLMESMVLRTHGILDYYGDPESLIPRCF